MSGGDGGVPVLVLGPLLRYVDDTAATIWVETDRACEAEILGRRARTFEVAGHHYALVLIEGLRPASEYKYQVALDGAVRWPEPGSGFPPSAIRTTQAGRPLRMLFGSCRVTEPLVSDPEPDALVACAEGLRRPPRERWPDVLLLIGDQVAVQDHRRLHELLALSAPRQPVAGRTRQGRIVAPGAGVRRRGRRARRHGRPRRPARRGHPVELPARLRRCPHRRDRLAQPPGPRAGQAADHRRGRMAVGHRRGVRRPRPRGARHLASAVAPARHPGSGGGQRGGVRRGVGQVPRAQGRGAAAGRGPGTLGGVRHVVRTDCAVYEAVCSPIHNALSRSFRVMHKLATSRPGELGAAVFARLAGAREPRIGWRISDGPWFENMLAAMEFDGRGARIRFDRAVPGADGAPGLEPVCEARLTRLP